MDATYTVNSIGRRINSKDILKYSFASGGVYVAVAVMLLLKSILAFDVFMSAVIPLLAFTVGVYFYSSYRNSNMSLAFVTITLNAIGFSLMCLISPEGLVLKHIVAMVLAIGIFAAVRFATEKINFTALLIIISVASVLLYLILVLMPSDNTDEDGGNNVRAWLVIGGVSVQLTELIKILFVVFLAVLYSSKMKNSLKLVWLLGCLVINTGFSAYIEELGSLLVILVVAYMVQLIFGCKKQTWILTALAVLAITTAAVLIFCTQITFSNETIQELIELVRARVKNSDPYQLNQAKKALVNGGLWGTTHADTIYVPIKTSDFAFTSLVQHMGLVVATITLVLFTGIIYLLSRNVNLSDINCNSVLAVVSVLLLSFQSVYIIMSNTGLVPLTGINCIFLSDGGTTIMVSYVLTLFIISGMAKERRNINERAKRVYEA